MWASHDTNTSVHYIEDNFINLDYVMVLGENYKLVAPLITEHVRVVPRSEVIQYAKDAQTWEEMAYAVEGVAATASSEFDTELFGIIGRAIHHDNEEVRHAALRAIAYVEWHECANLILELAAHDPNNEIKSNAAKLHKTLQQDVWS